MFRTDAFGRRIPCNLRLRFVTDPDGGTGATDEVELDGEKFAFPTKTPVADMTPEQAAEYWRHQSKVQQKRGATPPADYAELQQAKKDLEELRRGQLDDHQREVEEAREQARREGENIGSEKYLADAVKAKFQLLTQKTDEEVATAFAHVDPKSFTDANGEIVADKLQAFAEVFGTPGSSSTQQQDPVAAALARQRAAGGGTGSSIADKRKATRESLTKPKA